MIDGPRKFSDLVSGSDTPPVRTDLIVGVAVLVVFFGVFVLWSSLAPLAEAAIARGSLVVDGNRKSIQHLEGGIIREILVDEGDEVDAGQVLVRLDQTRSSAQLDVLQGRHMEALARFARLQAERGEADTVDFSVPLEAYGANPNLEDIIAGQTSIFERSAESHKSQVAVLEQRVAQLREEQKGIRNEIAAQGRQIALIEEEVVGVRTLVEKGFARKPRLLALERDKAELEGERAINQGQVARLDQSMGEARLRISELQAERLRRVVEEERETQAQIFDLTERIKAAQDVSSRTEIRAPQAGTVVGLEIHTTGGVVAPGQVLMDIVPDEDVLIAEARLNPDDIEKVVEGQRAEVRLTAFSRRFYEPVQGVVVFISADSFTDEQTRETYYVARVALPAEEIAKTFGEQELRPGMQAEVMIQTGERTLLDYLLRPISRTLEHAMREE